jgi:two-component system CheB/CheR fusion protein
VSSVDRSTGAVRASAIRVVTGATTEGCGLSPVAHLLVDRDGIVVRANDSLLDLVGRSQDVVGRPLRELGLEDRGVPLSSLIHGVIRGDGTTKTAAFECSSADGVTRRVTVAVTAVGRNGRRLGTSVTLVHADAAGRIDGRHVLGREALRSLAAELDAANAELRSRQAELLLTNEQLRLTRDELLSATSVLVSTRAQLVKVTAAQRLAAEERRRTRRVLEAAVGGLRLAIAVIDRDLRVTAWSRRATELWGVGLDAVRDRPLADLDIGIPIDQIHDAARACIEAGTCQQERLVNATDGSGRHVVARIVCVPLWNPSGHLRGAAILIDTLGTHNAP